MGDAWAAGRGDNTPPTMRVYHFTITISTSRRWRPRHDDTSGTLWPTYCGTIEAKRRGGLCGGRGVQTDCEDDDVMSRVGRRDAQTEAGRKGEYKHRQNAIIISNSSSSSRARRTSTNR